MKKIKINAVGKQCPLPVIETKEAVEKMTVSGIVEVIVDNEIAVQNICKFAKQKNLAAEILKNNDDTMTVFINNDKGIQMNEMIQVSDDPVAQEQKMKTDSTVVVISSDEMGTGDRELSMILLKGFIFALTKQTILPKAVIFYNRGALITCEQSESVEDLIYLESLGVEVRTCGTCLNHYHLADKLLVGTVTNMYEIVDMQIKASKVIMP